MNALDQAMWDLLAAVTAALHDDTTYRAHGLRSFVEKGPRQATFRGR